MNILNGWGYKNSGVDDAIRLSGMKKETICPFDE